MNKAEFLEELKSKLSDFNEHDLQKTLDFYQESIKDRVEEGKTEQEAISNLGDIDDIVQEIKMHMPITSIVQSKIKKSKKNSKNKTLWMVLAICGIPIWLPISLTLFAVGITAYALLWVSIFIIFALIICLVALTVVFVIYGVVLLTTSNIATGLALLGASLVSSGIFIACIKPTIWSIKKLGVATGSFFTKVKKLLLKNKEAS